jgi:dipeptidase D
VSELSQLSPQPLWDIFAKICSIPHPSYHEEQLAEHIMGWAKEKGLHAERDQVGNILIRKPATAGMENRKPVVLQAHLDMVPQKNNDTVHDFTKDPIQPYIDGDWVKARGTTWVQITASAWPLRWPCWRMTALSTVRWKCC